MLKKLKEIDWEEVLQGIGILLLVVAICIFIYYYLLIAIIIFIVTGGLVLPSIFDNKKK